mgnify:CR=1 FL=1
MGFAPSGRFDPAYYRDRYPDLRNIPNCLKHYLHNGQHEGRRPVSLATQVAIDVSRIDPNRQTILMVSHMANRTGAPILAYNIAMKLRQKYNIVVLVLRGGELVDDFTKICASVVGPFNPDQNEVESEYLVRHLLRSLDIFYVIANTIESRDLLKPLTLHMVPVVTLVHEFASHLRPKGAMGSALEWSTEIVFSADNVAESVKMEYPNIANRRYHILRQGQCVLPPVEETNSSRHEARRLRQAIRPVGFEQAFVVLGCGTIFMRKGVDLFLSCAATVRAMKPARLIRFIWIGQHLEPNVDGDYYNYLLEQIRRSALEDYVVILDAVNDLDSAYSLADLYLLSSRFDPLPNVAIEAARRGLPIVCFENTGGIPEFLQANAITRRGIVPHLDVHAAAGIIASLADDEAAYRAFSRAIYDLGHEAFDMDGYVAKIDQVGWQAVSAMHQRRRDFDTINDDLSFDLNLYLGRDTGAVTREDGIRFFLARSAALGTGDHPTANFYYRRPSAGFHPQVYAYENARSYDIASINPLAHFIRMGKPDGPWRHEVIQLPTGRIVQRPELKQKTAIHAHFHYPELAGDFLRRLEYNSFGCDLLISTNDGTKEDLLRETFRRYTRGQIIIRTVTNRGRDIGPFLSEFNPEITRYDIVGHLHGKRSLFTDPIIGETWREFLWEHLLGDIYPMMDIVLEYMSKHEDIGLVFAEEAHLSDWDQNRDRATDLARRIDIKMPLPPYFDFPVGTMFWARPAALAPLFELGLKCEDYPVEPIAIDGTILHAIERLLPLIARRAGFRYATTHIPGVTW